MSISKGNWGEVGGEGDVIGSRKNLWGLKLLYFNLAPELRKKIKSSITVADNAPFANQEAYDGHSGTTDAQYEGPHAFQARPGWMNNKETSCFDTPEYAIRPIAHFKSPKGPIPEYLRKKPVTKNKSVGMKGS